MKKALLILSFIQLYQLGLLSQTNYCDSIPKDQYPKVNIFINRETEDNVLRILKRRESVIMLWSAPQTRIPQNKELIEDVYYNTSEGYSINVNSGINCFNVNNLHKIILKNKGT